MNTKTKLKTFFDSEKENAQYIEMYEENIDFFNNLLESGHKEDIEFVIPIKMYKYADPLNKTGDYHKSLVILSEIENDLKKMRGKSKWYNQYYDGMIFLKGVCLGRLKKYSASNKEFEMLLKKKPDNNVFKNWYKSNKKNQRLDLLDKISIIAIIFYLIVLFAGYLGYKIDSLFIRDIGLVISLLAFVTSYIWQKIT